MDSFLLKKIFDENSKGKSAVLVTILNNSNEYGITEGEIFVLLEKDIVVGKISNLSLEKASTQIASKLIKNGESKKLYYQNGEFSEKETKDSIALYFKVFRPKSHLIIIGYNPFIQMLLKVIPILPFDVTLINNKKIDDKECCKEIISGDIIKILEKLEQEQHVYFIVDVEEEKELKNILKLIIKRNFDYLGLKVSYEKLKSLSLDPKELEYNKEKIYAPFYYDIKYKSDGEKVVALLAQLISVKNKS